jgi:hypothetical protein
VRVQQSETGAVVESTIEIDGLDLGVKAVEEFEKLSEDIAGDVAGDDLVQLLRGDFDVLAEVYRKFIVKIVDDKIK